MTTTEKRGFRLPWGAENRKPDQDPSDTSSHAADGTPRKAATDLAAAIATDASDTGDVRSAFRRGSDDLGRGPFDLGPITERDPASDPDDALVEVVEPGTKKPESKGEVAWGVTEAASVATAATPAPAPAAPVAAADPVAAGAPAWPDMDRRGSAAHVAADVPLPPRPPVVVDGAPRKANPLMAGLVKAMRDAAKAARDETTARMRTDAAARIDEIKAESVATAAALKKQADEDIAAIKEWSKSEAARIKQETETRIADRRTRLGQEVQDQTAAATRMTDDVKGGIAGFEAEMDRFFEQLLKEDDPARLATLAERLPEAPSFARPSGSVAVPVRRQGSRSGAPRRRTEPGERRPRAAARLAPDAAAAAEAEAIAGLDDELGHELDPTAPDVPAADDLATLDEPVAPVAVADVAVAEPVAVDEPEAIAEPLAEPEPAPALEPHTTEEPTNARDWADLPWSSEVEPATPEPAGEAPAADLAGEAHDHDTNGHEAVAVDPDIDAEALAAWTEALAAIRVNAGLGDDGPDPAAQSAEVASAAPTETFEPDLADEPVAPGSLLAVLQDAPRIDSPDDLSPEERIALLGFDETASPDPEPQSTETADANVEDVTRVVVSGLTSVGGISAFKSALTAVAGVLSVSVTSGNDGAFVFSVVHAGTTDLRVAVPGFERFSPQATGDEGAVLDFAVTEPAP